MRGATRQRLWLLLVGWASFGAIHSLSAVESRLMTDSHNKPKHPYFDHFSPSDKSHNRQLFTEHFKELRSLLQSISTQSEPCHRPFSHSIPSMVIDHTVTNQGLSSAEHPSSHSQGNHDNNRLHAPSTPNERDAIGHHIEPFIPRCHAFKEFKWHDFLRDLQLNTLDKEYAEWINQTSKKSKDRIKKSIKERLDCLFDFLFAHVAGYILSTKKPVDQAAWLATALHHATKTIKATEFYVPKHRLEYEKNISMSLVLHIRFIDTPEDRAMLQRILEQQLTPKPDIQYENNCFNIAHTLALLAQDILPASPDSSRIHSLALRLLSSPKKPSHTLGDIMELGQSLDTYHRMAGHSDPLNPQDIPPQVAKRYNALHSFHKWTQAEKERQDRILATMLLAVQCSNTQSTKADKMVMNHYARFFDNPLHLMDPIHRTLIQHRHMLSLCFEDSQQ